MSCKRSKKRSDAMGKEWIFFWITFAVSVPQRMELKSADSHCCSYMRFLLLLASIHSHLCHFRIIKRRMLLRIQRLFRLTAANKL